MKEHSGHVLDNGSIDLEECIQILTFIKIMHFIYIVTYLGNMLIIE